MEIKFKVTEKDIGGLLQKVFASRKPKILRYWRLESESQFLIRNNKIIASFPLACQVNENYYIFKPFRVILSEPDYLPQDATYDKSKRSINLAQFLTTKDEVVRKTARYALNNPPITVDCKYESQYFHNAAEIKKAISGFSGITVRKKQKRRALSDFRTITLNFRNRVFLKINVDIKSTTKQELLQRVKETKEKAEKIYPVLLNKDVLFEESQVNEGHYWYDLAPTYFSKEAEIKGVTRTIRTSVFFDCYEIVLDDIAGIEFLLHLHDLVLPTLQAFFKNQKQEFTLLLGKEDLRVSAVDLKTRIVLGTSIIDISQPADLVIQELEDRLNDLETASLPV